MTPSTLILRFGELWLKGGNRRDFIAALARRLRAGLRPIAPQASLVVRHDRMEIELGGAEVAAPLALARSTPGLARVVVAHRVERDLEAITSAGVALVAAQLHGAARPSFRVASRRSDKSYSHTSPELNRHLAEAVLGVYDLPVDLRRAELTLGCEIATHGCFVWVEDHAAVGGLPVGTAGKVMLLLSGGIDSPVAGHLAQRRGCELEAIYFHSPPFVPEETRQKVSDLGSILSVPQGKLILHSVHFTAIQKAIRDHCDSQHTVLLYRRFMVRIADKIATQRRCQALVTGENLGQVASQTIENINLVDRLGERLILRPLLTYDKSQVIELARALGTYAISIRPFDDCCTLFVPKNPTTRGRLRVIEAQERRLDGDALVAEAVAQTERIELQPR